MQQKSNMFQKVVLFTVASEVLFTITLEILARIAFVALWNHIINPNLNETLFGSSYVGALNGLIMVSEVMFFLNTPTFIGGIIGLINKIAYAFNFIVNSINTHKEK